MTTSFRYKVDRLVAQQTSCAVMTYGPNGVVFQNIEPPPPPPPKPPPPPTNLLDRHEPADKDTRLKLDRKTGKVRFAKEDEDWDDD